MSSSEDHDDWDDPPPARPVPLEGSEFDSDMDDTRRYHSSHTLEIDYIAVPTLGTLEMRRDEYQRFPEESRVSRCVREVMKDGGLWYTTVFADGHTDLVSYHKLSFQNVQYC